jgi:predicted N-formylglutamate amidohydrolase
VLQSHRGWDPGSLEIGRTLSRELGAPLLTVDWSRLLVESNRSPHNPRIWSEFTAGLSPAERQQILDRYWWPHRNEVLAAVQAGVDSSRRVVHIAVHSFTGVLRGEERNAEISLLYDPARPGEVDLCNRWIAALRELFPEFRVRRNYPYRGNADDMAAAPVSQSPVRRDRVGIESNAVGWQTLPDAKAILGHKYFQDFGPAGVWVT